MVFSTALLFPLFILLVHCFPGQVLRKPEGLAREYDFIIVGSGPSGLVVATRLTENPRIRVLVIESGEYVTGETEFMEVLMPTKYPGGPRSAPPLRHFWRTTTGPNPFLAGRSSIISTGKIVGGGSAVNAMVWGRAGKRDFDDWAKLVGDRGWGWDTMKKYLNKAERFTPPDSEFIRKGNVTYNLADHGHNGPIHSSFPEVFFDSHIPFIKAEKALGIPQPRDQASGNIVGSLWVPVSVRPVEYIRSFSVNEYYRPVKEERQNLHLIYNQTVTRVLFRGKTAVGVEFQAAKGEKVNTVTAKREVILAAGAVKAPQLLMVSGVGKKDLLKSFRIPVVHDLPNVGEGFSDHGNLPIRYNVTNPPEEDWWNNSNRTFLDQQFEEYLANRTGYFTTAFSNRMLLLSLPLIAPETYKSILSKYTEKRSPAAAYLRPGVPSSFVKAYRKQRDLLLTSLATNDSAVDQGTSGRFKSLLRPFSRGYISIRSNSIWDEPILDPRTLSHPLDVEIMLAAVRWNRKLLNHPEVKSALNTVEIVPSPEDITDEQLITIIRNGMSPTGGHPCCTLGMGSVVDSKLKVKGLKGLRVVDSSAWPFVPGAHATQSTAYGFAEKAADLIKESL